jgi:uncharacterized protein YjbJ (UPF0337 family)
MIWTQIETKWHEVKRHFKARWEKLTDEDVSELSGDRHDILMKLVEKYGGPKDQIERDLDAFVGALPDEHDEQPVAKNPRPNSKRSFL